jgi:hypothetical protein
MICSALRFAGHALSSHSLWDGVTQYLLLGGRVSCRELCKGTKNWFGCLHGCSRNHLVKKHEPSIGLNISGSEDLGHHLKYRNVYDIPKKNQDLRLLASFFHAVHRPQCHLLSICSCKPINESGKNPWPSKISSNLGGLGSEWSALSGVYNGHLCCSNFGSRLVLSMVQDLIGDAFVILKNLTEWKHVWWKSLMRIIPIDSDQLGRNMWDYVVFP